ncbi:unnamed protein product, partial [Trichogramma brassicae]
KSNDDARKCTILPIKAGLLNLKKYFASNCEKRLLQLRQAIHAGALSMCEYSSALNLHRHILNICLLVVHNKLSGTKTSCFKPGSRIIAKFRRILHYAITGQECFKWRRGNFGSERQILYNLIKADEKCVSKAKQGRERTQEHNKRYNKEFSKSFQLAGLLYTAKRETKLRLRLAELSGLLLEPAKKYNSRTRIDLLWKIFSKLFNVMTFHLKSHIFQRHAITYHLLPNWKTAMNIADTLQKSSSPWKSTITTYNSIINRARYGETNDYELESINKWHMISTHLFTHSDCFEQRRVWLCRKCRAPDGVYRKSHTRAPEQCRENAWQTTRLNGNLPRSEARHERQKLRNSRAVHSSNPTSAFVCIYKVFYSGMLQPKDRAIGHISRNKTIAREMKKFCIERVCTVQLSAANVELVKLMQRDIVDIRTRLTTIARRNSRLYYSYRCFCCRYCCHRPTSASDKKIFNCLDEFFFQLFGRWTLSTVGKRLSVSAGRSSFAYRYEYEFARVCAHKRKPKSGDCFYLDLPPPAGLPPLSCPSSLALHLCAALAVSRLQLQAATRCERVDIKVDRQQSARTMYLRVCTHGYLYTHVDRETRRYVLPKINPKYIFMKTKSNRELLSPFVISYICPNAQERCAQPQSINLERACDPRGRSIPNAQNARHARFLNDNKSFARNDFSTSDRREPRNVDEEKGAERSRIKQRRRRRNACGARLSHARAATAYLYSYKGYKEAKPVFLDGSECSSAGTPERGYCQALPSAWNNWVKVLYSELDSDDSVFSTQGQRQQPWRRRRHCARWAAIAIPFPHVREARARGVPLPSSHPLPNLSCSRRDSRTLSTCRRLPPDVLSIRRGDGDSREPHVHKRVCARARCPLKEHKILYARMRARIKGELTESTIPHYKKEPSPYPPKI